MLCLLFFFLLTVFAYATVSRFWWIFSPACASATNFLHPQHQQNRQCCHILHLVFYAASLLAAFFLLFLLNCRAQQGLLFRIYLFLRICVSTRRQIWACLCAFWEFARIYACSFLRKQQNVGNLAGIERQQNLLSLCSPLHPGIESPCHVVFRFSSIKYEKVEFTWRLLKYINYWLSYSWVRVEGVDIVFG